MNEFTACYVCYVQKPAEAGCVAARLSGPGIAGGEFIRCLPLVPPGLAMNAGHE
jgi:hypothetical protein